MRAFLGAVFLLFFVGALACGLVLGGPPASVYRFGDTLTVAAGGLLFMASMVLLTLVFGAGTEGKKRSLLKLPLLCLVSALICFVFSVAIFAADLDDVTPQHAALNLRLKISAGMMIVFGLFCGVCAIAAYFLAKYHNGKLPAA